MAKYGHLISFGRDNLQTILAAGNRTALLKLKNYIEWRIADCQKLYPWKALMESWTLDLIKVEARLKELVDQPMQGKFVGRRKNKR